MNLRDLQYLSAVAEHLHFGHAADACHVSQPTLSMQLKKLEEELGVQLFERTNKSVRLTAVGRDITQRAERILREADSIRIVASASTDPLAGEIRLGVFPTLAPYLLPSLMPLLGKHFPKLSTLLIEEKTPELVARLEGGEIDAALLAVPVESESFLHETLFDEPFLLALGKDHKLARKKRITLRELVGETMLLLEDGHCLREQALSVCHAIGAGEAKHFRATSLETLRHMVAGGDSVTLMPALAAQGDTSLRYIPFAAPAPSRTIGLYWRKTSARSALFEKMAEAIRSA